MYSMQKLRREYEAAVRDNNTGLFLENLREALREGHLQPGDFSIRGLVENFIEGGREIVDSWNPRHGDGNGGISLMEAGAVGVGTFSNITGQILYTTVLNAFESEAYVFSAIVPDIPTQFNGEKIPGIGRIGDKAEIIGEGQPYPLVGLNEDWIQTPETLKRGMRMALTREAVFFDRTNLLIQQASEVGEFLGLNKEKRLIDAFVDENTTAHRYNWKGTTYASYQTSSPWDNVTASNALVDWTDIDAAEQTLAAITDPNTGEPIMNMPKDLVVTRQNMYTAKRIVNATEIDVATPGYATAGNPTRTRVTNPVQNYRIVSSQLLASRMATDTDWYLGDIAKMIAYMENFPLTVQQAPPNSTDEFERDIVAQWKAGERGAAVVREPRVTNKSTA